MAFLEDPRLRQRWNQISHNAEGVAENAAAEIWTFQHRYITPCLSAMGGALDSCTGVCMGGDREERARRQRERERGARRTRAEYSFDFYDDWDDDDDALAGYSYGSYGGFDDSVGGGGVGGGGGGGRFFGRWGVGRGEDWDRLLAGTRSSSSRNRQATGGAGASDDDIVVDNQPRRKATMRYGATTTPPRRKVSAPLDDPTIIPSTSSFGFLGRLPFRIGGTLRYKPSAANLQDHPGATASGGARRDGEHEPLLGGSDDEEGDHGEDVAGTTMYSQNVKEYHSDFDEEQEHMQRMTQQQQQKQRQQGRQQQHPQHRNYQDHQEVLDSPKTRKRSSTTGSGATSDSYRSRGDLFPSDGEGDEDAVPLEDDEFAVALDRVVDDRSSGKTGRSSSQGKGKGKRKGKGKGKGKGKRRADQGGDSGANLGSNYKMSRSVSRTTMASSTVSSSRSQSSLNQKRAGSVASFIAATEEEEEGEGQAAAAATVQLVRTREVGEETLGGSMLSMEDLHLQVDRLRGEEDGEPGMRRAAVPLPTSERWPRPQSREQRHLDGAGGEHEEHGDDHEDDDDDDDEGHDADVSAVDDSIILPEAKEDPLSIEDMPEPSTSVPGGEGPSDRGEHRNAADDPPGGSLDEGRGGSASLGSRRASQSGGPEGGSALPATVAEAAAEQDFFPAKLPHFR